MAIFDGTLICTDLDGTLLRKDKTISKENLDAIEYFKANGGYFTYVTGRMPFFSFDTYERIKPNAPFGCINGGGLYDFEKKDYVMKQVISDKVMELVKCIDENFPKVGIQVNTFYKTYFCKDNSVLVHFREICNAENYTCDYMNVEEPVAKILFGVETEEEISGMAKMLREHPLADDFEFIRSERTLYEILPKGITKGTAIKGICDYLGLDANKTVAIGDYDNDIPMLKAAKIGVAVSNACENAKKVADYITVSNEEHAIARLIYDLEKGIIK
ncbi:MAG: HAD family phosphatase [Ruminococcaceae bacterium]|nr:HAD family phosphatase [Oscillospiraceae bacterium]